MIFRCSGKIARHLCLSEIISEDEYELYQYAVFFDYEYNYPIDHGYDNRWNTWSDEKWNSYDYTVSDDKKILWWIPCKT